MSFVFIQLSYIQQAMSLSFLPSYNYQFRQQVKPIKLLFSYHTDSTQPFSPVKLHYPKWSRISFPQQIWVSHYCFSFQSSHFCHPAFIIASRAHHKHSKRLMSKMVYSVFKSLRPVNSKIPSSNLRTKKLKQGHLSYPNFDIKYH